MAGEGFRPPAGAGGGGGASQVLVPWQDFNGPIADLGGTHQGADSIGAYSYDPVTGIRTLTLAALDGNPNLDTIRLNDCCDSFPILGDEGSALLPTLEASDLRNLLLMFEIIPIDMTSRDVRRGLILAATDLQVPGGTSNGMGIILEDTGVSAKNLALVVGNGLLFGSNVGTIVGTGPSDRGRIITRFRFPPNNLGELTTWIALGGAPTDLGDFQSQQAYERESVGTDPHIIIGFSSNGGGLVPIDGETWSFRCRWSAMLIPDPYGGGLT